MAKLGNLFLLLIAAAIGYIAYSGNLTNMISWLTTTSIGKITGVTIGAIAVIGFFLKR